MSTVEINTLRDFVQWRVDSMGEAGPAPMEALILKHGREGKPVPHKYRMGRLKNCFQNAARLALRNHNLTYVEGYAMRADLGIPIFHAWLIDKDGGVIDVTWRGVDETTQYIGIPIQHDVLSRELLKNKVYGVFNLGITYNTRLMREIDPELMDQFLKKKERAA